MLPFWYDDIDGSLKLCPSMLPILVDLLCKLDISVGAVDVVELFNPLPERIK